MAAKLRELGRLLFSCKNIDSQTALYKRVTIFVGTPIVVGLGIYNWIKEMEHIEHEKLHPPAETPKYSYLNIRSKAFPWENGDKCSLLDFECHRRANAEKKA